MKKVLIIANLFHASPRIPGLAKYLPEFGWKPVILTPPLGENPDSRFGPPNDFKEKNWVIETFGYSSQHTWKRRGRLASKKLPDFVKAVLRFIYKHYLEVVNYPDEEKGWKTFALKSADDFLAIERADAIISSSSPVTAHIIARELKEKYRIPWVADLRDLWSQNHAYPHSFLRRFFDRMLEKRTLKTADALVTVSLPWAERLMQLHNGKMAYEINNGFDPDDVNGELVKLTSKLTITYTGQIYIKGQDPAKFLLALKQLIDEGEIRREDVEVGFYGPEHESLSEQIQKYDLSNIVKQHGIISRKESIQRQRESQVLLFFKWEKGEHGWHSGKIYEYLAARRPILATGGEEDVVTELLNQTNAGVAAPTIEDIKSALRKLYVEYKLSGRISYHGSMKEISKYSYLEMARKFAAVLDDLQKRGI